MKKLLIAFIALFVLSINSVQAVELKNFSNDSKIISSLKLLENVGANEVFNNLTKTKSKIMFYDLTLIDFSYGKHFAVASTDEYGDNYILINSNFRNSNPEAVACLIAHESMHTLPQATLAEETLATTTEARYWLKLKPTKVKKDRLTDRLNNLERLVIASSQNNNLIAQKISQNTFYQKQLAN